MQQDNRKQVVQTDGHCKKTVDQQGRLSSIYNSCLAGVLQLSQKVQTLQKDGQVNNYSFPFQASGDTIRFQSVSPKFIIVALAFLNSVFYKILFKWDLTLKSPLWNNVTRFWNSQPLPACSPCRMAPSNTNHQRKDFALIKWYQSRIIATFVPLKHNSPCLLYTSPSPRDQA